ncbi:MAG: amidohydrolase [Blastocatellia bacterium]|nr:amidohydrolase [Blastocatellia bacterium]
MPRKSRFEPEPRLPLKLDATSNGEYHPVPLHPDVQLVKSLAMEQAETNARRLGWSRRRFLMSACGVATTMLCMNQVFAHRGNTGGFFDVSPDMALDPEAAATVVAGDEFIFDVQTHHIRPSGEWLKRNQEFVDFMSYFGQTKCGESDPANCLTRDHYIKELFLDSDTAMAVLSAVPPVFADVPLTTEEADATRAVVEKLDGSPRLQIHGLALPNLEPKKAQLEAMQRLVEQWKIKAWKVYTPWGPDKKTGWWLDDPTIGIPFIEKARELGVKIICAHKGLSLPGFTFDYASPRDIGAVAKMFPDVTFIVYHSGFEPSVPEGPYDPNTAKGIDALIKSLHDHGIPPNANVYAELGSTWRQVMKNPAAAAHVIGKLLRFVGEDRVLWGTDSIWFGSPQDQIQAFRAFQISQEFQERYGYPALTKEIKAKVFGLNATVPYGIDPKKILKRIRRDQVEKTKIAYMENPQPSFSTHGPRTRREFLSHLHQRDGWPA